MLLAAGAFEALAAGQKTHQPGAADSFNGAHAVRARNPVLIADGQGHRGLARNPSPKRMGLTAHVHSRRAIAL